MYSLPSWFILSLKRVAYVDGSCISYFEEGSMSRSYLGSSFVPRVSKSTSVDIVYPAWFFGFV